MELSLSQNLIRLRKQRAITQEQLAEAIGVSFAAVSKWERGAATPELATIAELADYFGVSVDALIGYQMQRSDRESLIARLRAFLHDRNTLDALETAEMALRRFPNCFEIVYYAADNYSTRGLYLQKPEYTQRALELYRHACQLISQNTDPEISIYTLQNAIAELHLTLGEYDAGLEILKRYNPCRRNHARIGMALACHGHDAQEALPYLSTALLYLVSEQMHIVIGYVNLYGKQQAYENAAAVVEWALASFAGLHLGGKPSFLDKSEAMLLAVLAQMQLHLGKESVAAESLRRAKALAETFDAAPCYDARAIRFVSPDELASSADDFGQTALLGIETVIAEFESDALRALWRAICNENETA